MFCDEAMFLIFFKSFFLSLHTCIIAFIAKRPPLNCSMKEPTYTDWCVNNKTPCKVSIYYQKHKSLCKQKAFKFAYHLDAELVKWRRIHSNLLNGVNGIPPHTTAGIKKYSCQRQKYFVCYKYSSNPLQKILRSLFENGPSTK